MFWCVMTMISMPCQVAVRKLDRQIHRVWFENLYEPMINELKRPKYLFINVRTNKVAKRKAFRKVFKPLRNGRLRCWCFR